MNPAFRDYVFGTAFTLHLRENQIRGLAELCRDGAHGYVFDMRIVGALQSRGLIVPVIVDDAPPGRTFRYRPTRAGLLVYDLLVEAGEEKALAEKRRRVIEAEHELDQEEWDKRYGRIELRLKAKAEPERNE